VLRCFEVERGWSPGAIDLNLCKYWCHFAMHKCFPGLLFVFRLLLFRDFVSFPCSVEAHCAGSAINHLIHSGRVVMPVQMS
jgi:hypothetical protein